MSGGEQRKFRERLRDTVAKFQE
jgi:hypothetical protein